MRCVYAAIMLAGALVCGCTSESRSVAGAPAARVPASVDVFDGVVYPARASKLRAPDGSFSLAGSVSERYWVKLKILKEDGAEVKKGEMVARFEFNGKSAQSAVRRMIQNASASKERLDVDVLAQTREMVKDRDYKDLNASLSQLDTQRGESVAAVNLERFKIDHELNDFEASAQRKRLRAYRLSAVTQRAYEERRVERASRLMEIYEYYKARAVVRAPHDGIVRHGYNPRRGRKIQQGDGMPAGMVVASVARDATLHVKFFVPEHRFKRARTHEVFEVRPASSEETYEVRVLRVEDFPQELGFVKDDYELPNAREKVFVFHAKFVEPPEGLNAGVDLKVGLP